MLTGNVPLSGFTRGREREMWGKTKKMYVWYAVWQTLLFKHAVQWMWIANRVVCVCVCVCIRVWECLLTTAPLLLQVTAEGKWRRVPELTSALPVGVLPFLTVSSSFSRLILRCKCTLSPRKIYIYRKLRAFPTSKQRRKTRRKDD